MRILKESSSTSKLRSAKAKTGQFGLRREDRRYQIVLST